MTHFHMNPILITLVATFLLIWTCGACDKRNKRVAANQVRVALSEEASQGLELSALVGVVKTASNAEDLEKILNRPGGINNLDLNADEKVDYLQVTEYGSKEKGYGFSITTEVEAGEVQEVATVELQKSQDNVNVAVAGNEQIYGQGRYYQSYYPVGSMLLWAYLLSPRQMYTSPWGYGNYPGYYQPYSRTDYDSYRQRNANYRRNSGAQRVDKLGNTGLTSPNKDKVAQSGIKRSLKNPTTTQKNFQERQASKSVRSGGFGRRSASSASRQTSARNFSRSSRSYGGFGK